MYRLLDDHKPALLHAKRFLKLAPKVWGKGSLEHVRAVQEVGSVELKLKDFISAKNRCNEAMAMLKALWHGK